jgi:PAS domain S-box-containing protein
VRKFIERALKKLSKLDNEQIHDLVYSLASENERIEVVLDSLADGIVVADEEHNVILVNKAAERLIPFTSSDYYERAMWDAIGDDDISAFVRTVLENQESVMDREFTLDHLGKDRILSCSVLPLVRDGHIQGNILHVEDVTERRNREARLRRAENLASLTTLAAGVAHEIKNPLGSIGIHIQLVEKALKEPEKMDSDKVQSYLAVVNEEVERLNKIVVDFLFAVRPMNVNLEERAMNSVVREVLEFVGHELQQAGIEIESLLAEDLPNLELDEKYLKQAIMNIVKNAMSAMPEGGTLRVATQRRGDQVELQISDTGVGMSEEVQQKIFEPYFTTRDYGSGIGLTLVYKVVKEHNADVTVRSQPEKGSTFTITFPVPQKEQHLLGWNGESA